MLDLLKRVPFDAMAAGNVDGQSGHPSGMAACALVPVVESQSQSVQGPGLDGRPGFVSASFSASGCSSISSVSAFVTTPPATLVDSWVRSGPISEVLLPFFRRVQVCKHAAVETERLSSSSSRISGFDSSIKARTASWSDSTRRATSDSVVLDSEAQREFTADSACKQRFLTGERTGMKQPQKIIRQ